VVSRPAKLFVTIVLLAAFDELTKESLCNIILS
jgi:hypothetical protein